MDGSERKPRPGVLVVAAFCGAVAFATRNLSDGSEGALATILWWFGSGSLGAIFSDEIVLPLWRWASSPTTKERSSPPPVRPTRTQVSGDVAGGPAKRRLPSAPDQRGAGPAMYPATHRQPRAGLEAWPVLLAATGTAIHLLGTAQQFEESGGVGLFGPNTQRWLMVQVVAPSLVVVVALTTRWSRPSTAASFLVGAAAALATLDYAQMTAWFLRDDSGQGTWLLVRTCGALLLIGAVASARSAAGPASRRLSAGQTTMLLLGWLAAVGGTADKFAEWPLDERVANVGAIAVLALVLLWSSGSLRPLTSAGPSLVSASLTGIILWYPQSRRWWSVGEMPFEVNMTLVGFVMVGVAGAWCWPRVDERALPSAHRSTLPYGEEPF